MHSGQFVFAQIMDFLPRHEFNACVRRYGGHRRPRGFSCRDQFLCLAFAQLTFRESLRDIQTCLRALGPKLYHAGFRGRISRSTLADANRAHDWRIYADFAQVLIARARNLSVNDPLDVTLQQTAYALDSTTIDLCLSLFPWARFRRRKGAVNCTRSWTCEAAFPVLCIFPTEKRTTSPCSTAWLSSPARFM